MDPDPKHCLLVQVLTPLPPHLNSFHVNPDFARMRIRIRNCEIISIKVPIFSRLPPGMDHRSFLELRIRIRICGITSKSSLFQPAATRHGSSQLLTAGGTINADALFKNKDKIVVYVSLGCQKGYLP